MLLEINFAASHIVSWLKSASIQITDEASESFILALSNLLKDKYQGHWDPNYPNSGNGYRAITSFDGHMDPLLLEAADKSQVPMETLQSCLPRNFVIWVDPLVVSFRVGDYGYPVNIYSAKIPVSPYLPKRSSPLRISSPNSAKHREDTNASQNSERNYKMVYPQVYG